VACGERADDLSDQFRLWLVGVNAKDLGRQILLLCMKLEQRCSCMVRKFIAYLWLWLRCRRTRRTNKDEEYGAGLD